MKLDDLKVDEKTKLLTVREMQISDEDMENLPIQLCRVITLYYVKEKELDLKIAFLEGRINTAIVEINSLQRHQKKEYEFGLNEGKNECVHGLLYDSLCTLIPVFNEEMRNIKQQKFELWTECYKECFDTNYEE